MNGERVAAGCADFAAWYEATEWTVGVILRRIDLPEEGTHKLASPLEPTGTPDPSNDTDVPSDRDVRLVSLSPPPLPDARLPFPAM